MTDPTPLSPAAQAVLDVYMNNCGWLDGPLDRDYRCAAAVLRAAVAEVRTDRELKRHCAATMSEMLVLDKLLAIAIELENQ